MATMMHKNLDAVFLYQDLPLFVVSIIDAYAGTHKEVCDTFNQYILPKLVKPSISDREIVVYYANHLTGNGYDNYCSSNIVNITYRYIKTTDYSYPYYGFDGRIWYKHINSNSMSDEELDNWDGAQYFKVHEESKKDSGDAYQQDWYIGDNINNSYWCIQNTAYVSTSLTPVYELRCWYEYEEYNIDTEELEISPDSVYTTVFAIKGPQSRNCQMFEALM